MEGTPQVLCKGTFHHISSTYFLVFEDTNFNEEYFIDAIRASCAAIQAQMVDDDNRKAGSDAHGRAKVHSQILMIKCLKVPRLSSQKTA